MPVEYSPAGLEYLLAASNAEKRFGKRDGQALCQDCGWSTESDQSGKSLFSIFQEVQSHQREHPQHEILLSEDICGTLSVGSKLRKRI